MMANIHVRSVVHLCLCARPAWLSQSTLPGRGHYVPHVCCVNVVKKGKLIKYPQNKNQTHFNMSETSNHFFFAFRTTVTGYRFQAG